MDVRLPDGTIVQNVPEGITQADLISRVKASGFQSTGGGAAVGGAKQPIGDREGQMTDIPYTIGGNAAEGMTAKGFPPEAAGGVGTAVNIGTGMLTGAGLGRVAASGIRGAGKLINMGKNVIDPWLPGGIDRAVGRTANAAAGPDQQAIINALRQNEQIVPGSMPNAGQAAAEVGRAEFSGLQEAVKGRLPTEYDAIAQAQNAARVKALRSVGQDKAAIDAAEKLRSTNAEANYGAVAKDVVVPVDQKINDLFARPSMKGAIVRAKELAKEAGRDFPGTAGGLTVENAQTLKMAMDDMTKNPERFGIGASEVNAIGKTRDEFVKWLSRESPGWDAARKTYSADSKPINQMEVGQYLEGKLTPALNDQGATGGQRAAAYAQALRDAPGTIKRATGQPRYDELGQVLNPTQLGAVESVGQDLARTATHERLAKAGGQKASELVGQVTPKVPSAGMFNPHYSVLRAVINRLEGKVEGKSLDRLAAAMQDPPALAKIMEGMSPRARAAIVKALQAETLQNRVMTGGGAVIGAGVGYEQGNQP